MIKRLKQLPDLGWQGVGEACSSSPEDHSLPWLSIRHFLKENSHTHCLHMSTHTDFSAHYQPTNSNSFIQSKLFFCHSSPWATTLLSLAFPCACLLSLCDLLLQEHALTWCSIRSSKYSNNFHVYRISSPLFSASCTTAFSIHPLAALQNLKLNKSVAFLPGIHYILSEDVGAVGGL